ncbi:MAG: hypothetical protein PVH91_00400 [Pseudomonadales bacterium]|jgi:hypothetical protein
MRVEAVLLMLAAAAAPVGARASGDDALPPGLLEFIGTMVESGGELVDPLAMDAALDAEAAGQGEAGRQEGEDASAVAAPVVAAKKEDSP